MGWGSAPNLPGFRISLESPSILIYKSDNLSLLAINALGDELEAAAAFCRAEGIGIEITDFFFPKNLDGDLSPQIESHIKAVNGIVPLVSHGPGFELFVVSIDPAIIDVCRRRHQAALAATIEVGASYYIGHANFNPLIKGPSYRKNWIRQTLDFWLPFADEAGKHDIVVCLENLWEPIPDIQAELISTGNHPNLRATFDNGHPLVFSNVPSSQWVATLGPMIAHCHLHDNSGEFDEHKPVGEGKENWNELVAALKKHSPDAVLVAESDNFKGNKLSIERLKSLID